MTRKQRFKLNTNIFNTGLSNILIIFQGYNNKILINKHNIFIIVYLNIFLSILNIRKNITFKPYARFSSN